MRRPYPITKILLFKELKQVPYWLGRTYIATNHGTANIKYIINLSYSLSEEKYGKKKGKKKKYDGKKEFVRREQIVIDRGIK
jgi:hypothetical protein